MRIYSKTCLAALVVAASLVSFPPVSSPAEDGGKVSLGAGTIAPPNPVWLIGSYDSAGTANVMTASWVGVACSDPACVTVSLREATYTFGNIMSRRAFTVSLPAGSQAALAAYAGTVSGRDFDKFAVTGYTPVRSDLVDAPYVGECPVVLECRLIETVELGLHTMFIGEILDVKADEAVLGENGVPDPALVDPILYGVGGYGFYGLGEKLGGVREAAREYIDQD